MSYLLNKTDGTLLINLVDGTADGPDINPGQNVSDLDLFGKNYPIYGQWLGENFIKLLQNFANSTAPTNPLPGELWYNTSTGFLNIYTGTAWKLVSPVLSASSAPASNTFGNIAGTQWWDNVNYQLNTWNGTNWTLIGPAYSSAPGSGGISGPQVATVQDTVGGQHTITEFYIAGNVVAIISNDTTFTLSPANPIAGFSSILPGFNLVTGTTGNVSTPNIYTANIVASGTPNFTGGPNTGTITGTWQLTTNSSIQATYADLAEFYEGDQEYQPGTVLIFGGDKEVTTTTITNDVRSAGVVTTNPAYIMNREQSGIAVCVALVGRTPCNVVGTVKKGEMLTTSTISGYATRVVVPTLGSIIGKALEDKDYDAPGSIEIVVGRAS
jgi:hypothetical protein